MARPSRLCQSVQGGSVAERFDGSGNFLSVHAFQSVGDPASNLPNGVNPDPWGYKAQAGYYTDQETGLILCGFRYYDYQQGRWLNRDPIGYNGGLNLYAYCGGNPVMRLDPSGLDWVDTTTNYASGYGDTLSMGATGWIRQRLGVDGVVDRCSGAYGAGCHTPLATGSSAHLVKPARYMMFYRRVEPPHGCPIVAPKS